MPNGLNDIDRVARAEEMFRKFMLELLSAEAYEGDSSKRAFFSFEMLRKMLGRFCGVIAGHLGCDSCTVNLQLYDWNRVNGETLYEWALDHLGRRGGWAKAAAPEILYRWAKDLCYRNLAEQSLVEETEGYLIRAGTSQKEIDRWAGSAPDEGTAATLEVETPFLTYRLQMLKNHMVFPYWR